MYDAANQLIRENNEAGGFTRTWTYDNAGNILERKEYTYTTGELDENGGIEVAYEYPAVTDPANNTVWGDLLTGYGTKTVTYDEIGNPETFGDRTFTWEHGRQLKSLEEGNTTWNYTYDAGGMRTGRSNGTVSYQYVYTGSQLTQMKVGSDTLTFTYDAGGTPLTVTLNDTKYYYTTNLQGDVVAILNSNGSEVGTYSYDAWGNCTVAGDASIMQLNPLRYRGYVYDEETQLYYLQSRYYDPAVGRFLNADAFAATGQGFTGNNMFAYCGNNPVMLCDSSGSFSVPAGALAYTATISLTTLFKVACVVVAVAILTHPDVQEAIKDTITAPKLRTWEEDLADEIEDQIVVRVANAPKKDKHIHIHHIVAQNDHRTARSRYVLETLFEHGVNNSINLIAVDSTLHQRLHTNVYYMLVDNIVWEAYISAPPNKAAQRESVEGAMNWLRGFIETLSLVSGLS